MNSCLHKVASFQDCGSTRSTTQRHRLFLVPTCPILFKSSRESHKVQEPMRLSSRSSKPVTLNPGPTTQTLNPEPIPHRAHVSKRGARDVLRWLYGAAGQRLLLGAAGSTGPGPLPRSFATSLSHNYIYIYIYLVRFYVICVYM